MRKVALREPFRVAVVGTSVTASHDNYFNESYVAVFERLTRPAVERLGVPYVVENLGMGNNPIIPAFYCTEAIVGERAAAWLFA